MKASFWKIATVLVIVIAFAACENEEGENENVVSTKTGNESHKMGENCMKCHKSGGSGEGWFQVAGTVYNEAQTTPNSNATVKFYTGANGSGTLKYTVDVDTRGNFYTTQSIDFGSGLYVSVEGSTTTKHMVTPVTSGQCNSCHGPSTEKIWAK